jgi:ParB family chromosome partitioning protein
LTNPGGGVSHKADMSKITWRNVRVKLSQLKPWDDNPRFSTKKQAEKIIASISEFGQVQTVAIDSKSALLTVHGQDHEIDARKASRILTTEERQRLAVLLHAGAKGGWDWDRIANIDDALLQQAGMDADLLRQLDEDAAAIRTMLGSDVGEIEPPELKDGDRAPFRQCTFTVHDEQFEEIAAALSKAKEQGGGESAVNENSNGNALAWICGRFNRG